MVFTIHLHRKHKLLSCIVVKHLDSNGLNRSKRFKFDYNFDPNLDLWWDQQMSEVTDECPPVWLDAEDPLFILYTRFRHSNDYHD